MQSSVLKRLFCISACFVSAPLFAFEDYPPENGANKVYICRAYNDDDMMVAMRIDRYEGNARAKVWKTCSSHPLMRCRYITCDQNY